MLTLNANVTFFTVNVNGSSNPSLPLPTFQASTHISVSIKPKPGFPIHTFPFPSPGVSHSLPHIPIHTFPSTHSHSRRGFPFPSTHISRARFAASRRSEGAGLARGMRVEVGALPPTDGGRGGGRNHQNKFDQNAPKLGKTPKTPRARHRRARGG